MSVAKLFTIAVGLTAAVVGLRIVAPWYDYQRLKGAMQDSVHQSHASPDGEMVSTVLAKAKELKLPLAPRDVHVERSGQGGVRLWAEYDVTLTFPLGFSHTQRFRPEVRAGR